MSEEVEFLPAEFEDRHRISNQCSSITNHSKAILSDLSEIAEAHFILRQEYEKLLAKYNGVFEWFAKSPAITWLDDRSYQKIAKILKDHYEGGLK